MVLHRGLTGPNNDIRHQQIISFITYRLSVKFQGNKSVLILPEYHDNGKIPDVSILDTRNHSCQLLVEICNSNKVKDDTNKVKEMMKETEMEFSYVVDKEKNIIYKVFNSDKENEVVKTLLGIRLQQFLNEI